MFYLRNNWKTLLSFLCGGLCWATPLAARAQVEALFASSRSGYAASDELVQKILACENSPKLLEIFRELLENNQLHRLSWDRGDLPLTTLPLSDWRWEAPTAKNGRIILAIDGPLVVAIFESHRKALQLSVHDYSAGSAISRGYASTPRYFAHISSNEQHVAAMSLEHFSHKSPELFKIYYYFAGPTRTIVNAKSLPRPVWLPTWAK